MTIRKLSADTLSQAQFHQIIEIEENCGLEPYTPKMLLECIAEMDTYACIMDESIAGFITIHPSTRYLSGGVYIVNLNVAKRYRRQGVAKKLILNACAEYAGSHSGKLVMLDVAKDNVAAMNLYRQLGFTVSDIPSGNGDTDVVMTIPLAQLLK